MVRVSLQEARVTFIVCCDTANGERIRIVGDTGALGGWDPDRGIELTTSKGDYPKWRLSLTLPAGRKIHYKYMKVQMVATGSFGDMSSAGGSGGGGVVRRRIGAIKWEELKNDDNRVVNPKPGATVLVDDGMFGVYNKDDLNRVETIAPNLVETKSQERALHAQAEKRAQTGLVGAVATKGDLGFDGQELIIVLYRLPIIATKDQSGEWNFKWDDDALYLTSLGLRKGLEALHVRPLWIGILNTQETIELEEQPIIADRLAREFSCVPVFLPKNVLEKFYQGFCKGVLWPLFHMTNYVKRNASGISSVFDQELWHVYKRVNRRFSEVVVSRYEKQLIWVHDYHLMLLPYYLRIKLSGVRIGFFLHIPWPSSEVFRLLPVRTELLKGLVSATLLGFHLFDYARHFLSACVRLLNIEHEARRGSLSIEYEGRHVTLRVSHIGVDPDHFRSRLQRPSVRSSIMSYQKKYQGVTILGAIDDLDFIKGIALKLVAFERYLASASTSLRAKVALIQVAIPKAARVEKEVRDEIRTLVTRINQRYGTPNHDPVVYIEEDISFDERLALYSVIDALLLTTVRDGLNLIPYEYIVTTPEGKGQLILSEFTGCSRALSSATRVNPWNINQLRDVIDNCVQKKQMNSADIVLKHKADIKYVTKHTTAAWAASFLRDLNEASEATLEVVRLGLGAGVGMRRLEFEELTLLSFSAVLKSYKEAKRPMFVFDYDGTLTTSVEDQSSHQAHIWTRPPEDVIQTLVKLSEVEKNSIYIVSGRKKEVLESGLGAIPKINIAAEHGFYFREANSSEWHMLQPEADLSWIEIASEIMTLYTERTDGSYVEEKTAGLVWHYLDADPEFGQWQSKEMHDHLETLLAGFNVQVVNGHGWIQVKLADVNKGKMVETVLEKLDNTPDFVLCCGDDRTDEDMFMRFESLMGEANAALYTCTVGVKPSKARYYLRGSRDVAQLISSIVDCQEGHEDMFTNPGFFMQ
eukprot:Plantae.Rhodophyta-Hildenbrandia_rubra.ctg4638.p1 GENE.Plantae.Rhodophyta-Hildenbrandia_rubra.ctg4638~~Plantae.Rhodophyta-Hildenbrandia_rubra.ctg4638.p1  ORF type:complete len:980 (-),score=167.09 Plantae.Rhodophyta-Hildenbrandia_rubra.ctg4638:1410-4349(-)